MAPVCRGASVAGTPRRLGERGRVGSSGGGGRRHGPLHLADEVHVDVVLQTLHRLLLVAAQDAAVVGLAVPI